MSPLYLPIGHQTEGQAPPPRNMIQHSCFCHFGALVSALKITPNHFAVIKLYFLCMAYDLNKGQIGVMDTEHDENTGHAHVLFN